MGWLYVHKSDSVSVLDALKQELSDKLEVIESSVKSNIAYLAVKNKESGEAFAVIALIRNVKNDYHNFGTKLLDETVMPYYFDCPAKILKALTPTQNENALKWRKACLEYKQAEKKRRSLNLTGKRVVIYGKTYRVVGKFERNWRVVTEHDGLSYRLSRKDVANLTVIED